MRYSLKELGDIITGGTPPKKLGKNAYGNKINFLTPRDMKGQFDSQITERRLSEMGLKFLKNKIVKSPSISVSCIGSNMGKVVFNLKDVITNQQINSICNFSHQVYPLYLFYLLSTQKRFLSFIGSAQGSTMPILNKNDFENLSFRIPSIDRQKKIARKLNLLDQKIRLNNQINQNLLKLSKIIFMNQFPDVYSGKQEIGNYLKIFDKDRIPLSKNQRLCIPGNYRYIGATGTIDYISKYNFDGTYLLLGEDGSVISKKNHPILQYVTGKFWPNNHTHILRGKTVSTQWLYLYFSCCNVRSIITGAVQLKISQKNLKSLKVKMPKKEELHSFEREIKPIFNRILENKKQNKTLTNIKNILLTKYF